MRVHAVLGIDDHVGAKVAQVEAGGRADARGPFAAHRFVERFEILADDLSALLAAIGIVAARAAAHEEDSLSRVFHGGPMRRMRIAKNTSRRKRSKAAISASMAATKRTTTTALTGNLTNALMKRDAMTKQMRSADIVPRLIARYISFARRARIVSSS